MTLFPPRKQKTEKKGVTPVVPFRAPDDIREYLAQMKERGYSATEVLIDLFRIGMDAERELGDQLKQLRARAVLDDISVGTLIGRIVKDTLPKKR